MARRKTVQVAASKDSDLSLTWQQERFVEYFIENGGNATLAAVDAGYSRNSAKEMGYENLTKPHIAQAVEIERARLRETLRFDREKALKILIGRATASLDDFTEVFEGRSNFKDKEMYAGLGFKRYAIKSIKNTENGIDFQLHDGLAALNELWEKLGLGSESGEKDWKSGLDNVRSIIERIRERRQA